VTLSPIEQKRIPKSQMSEQKSIKIQIQFIDISAYVKKSNIPKKISFQNNKTSNIYQHSNIHPNVQRY